MNSRWIEGKINLPPITFNLFRIKTGEVKGREILRAAGVDGLQVKVVERIFVPQTKDLIIGVLTSEDIPAWVEKHKPLLFRWFGDFLMYIMGKREGSGKEKDSEVERDIPPLMDEALRLLGVILKEDLLYFALEGDLEIDYLIDLLGYTGGAILLSFALFAAEELSVDYEQFRETVERVRETLDKILDEAVMMWGEVEMLRRVKEEDREEIRRIAAAYEVGMHE